MDVGQIAPRRLADTIVEQLETMILEGTLQPGERLPKLPRVSREVGRRLTSLTWPGSADRQVSRFLPHFRNAADPDQVSLVSGNLQATCQKRPATH